LRHLGDVSDWQIVQIIWDGAQSYHRLKWADTGFNYKTSSLPALEAAAKGYETAETIHRHKAAKRTAELTTAAKLAGSSKKSSASVTESGTGSK
jgi:hypothetical protein